MEYTAVLLEQDNWHASKLNDTISELLEQDNWHASKLNETISKLGSSQQNMSINVKKNLDDHQ